MKIGFMSLQVLVGHSSNLTVDDNHLHTNPCENSESSYKNLCSNVAQRVLISNEIVSRH